MLTCLLRVGMPSAIKWIYINHSRSTVQITTPILKKGLNRPAPAEAKPVEGKATNPAIDEFKGADVDTFVPQLPSNWNDVDPGPLAFPDSPPPALPRPVIFLHGFGGKGERWDHVMEWLSSGEEPVNKSGGVIQAGHFDGLDPEANLFSLTLSRGYNPIEKNKDELKEAVEAVLAKTGAKEVDLVVHSLGGLNSRHYLQDADERVNKLVMHGTPNHGSALANLEMFFRENFGFPVFPRSDDPDLRKVLGQLSVDKLDGDKQPKNPFLRELNNDWENQRAAADVLLIAGAGYPTATGGPGLTIFGDGVVTRSSSKLDGVERKTAWFRNHFNLSNSPKVMEATANFLVGNQMTQSENLFDRPEDVIRAAELVKRQREADPGEIVKVGIEHAERATKLPLLDPAFQMGLALGVLSSIMGGPKEILPLIEIGLNSKSGGNDVQADYNIDLARKEGQVQGSGFVDGRAFAEVANFDQGKVQWKSALGLQASGLTLEVGEDEKSITMKGELGGVPTDLKLNMLINDNGMLNGLETTGLFNGDDYHVKSTVDMGGLLKGGANHNGVMRVNGKVNGEDMERNYEVSVSKRDDGLEFNARVARTQANDQNIGVTVKVLDRKP
jgi:pimeloyl-ACP methyl ester carboxylesterase